MPRRDPFGISEKDRDASGRNRDASGRNRDAIAVGALKCVTSVVIS